VLRRRWHRQTYPLVGVVATMLIAYGGPAASASLATLPATTSDVSVLPDTSVAAATPVRDATASAVPDPAALPGPPVEAAPSIVAPFLSDLFCTYNGTKLAGLKKGCVDPLLGTYDPLDNCFWKKLEPQPPPGDPLWGGRSSAPPAAIYTVTCETHFGTTVGNAAATLQYSTAPPLNYGQPALTTLQALALSTFTTLLALSPVPAVGSAPPATAEPGVVGLPIWMWADIPPLFWDPKSYSTRVLLTKLSFSFRGMQVDWDMGDGHHVICSTPGSGYHTAPGVAYRTYTGPAGPSPDCGYTYQIVGSFPVSATVTWLVAFQVGKTTGTFVISRTTPAVLHKIGEVQVVTQ
jgi:hypothetical protein